MTSTRRGTPTGPAAPAKRAAHTDPAAHAHADPNAEEQADGQAHGHPDRSSHAQSDEKSEAIRAVLDAVRILHGNGADSGRTQARARQIGNALDTPVRVQLGWSSSAVVIDRSAAEPPVTWPFDDEPAGVVLNRVAAVDVAADDLSAGRAGLQELKARLQSAASLTPVGLGLFALACAVGACGLALVLGVQHVGTLAVVAASATVGALARRGLARLGANNYWQVAAAGCVAGLGGVASNRMGLSSPLGLAALCPCMILVPGPHLLKGAIDVASLRIGLGLARLAFAAVTLAAIVSGLLLASQVGHADLLTDPAARVVPLWVDAPAAGIVAVCYALFYSTPLRALVWPLLVGAAAHALHWVASSVWRLDGWAGAGLACLLVGAVLYPVASRRHVPFSAIGFASVVSLMPGVLVFRALAGLVQLQHATADRAASLILDTVNNLSAATLTVAAMTVGLLVPAAGWRWASPPISGQHHP